MENTFQTSFIPKKPITPVKSIRRGPLGIFPVLATTILVVAVISSIGLFFYRSYLEKQKDNLSLSLANIKDSFKEEVIMDLELFDERVNASRDILSSHLVLSPLFSLLGELTIPSIQYTKFEHETNEKGFTVKISGISKDYKSIALQADVFNGDKGRYFKNVIFSNLVKTKTNDVTFDLGFTVDPSLLSYESNILIKQNSITDNSLLDNSISN
jgi:hypothetical protein